MTEEIPETWDALMTRLSRTPGEIASLLGDLSARSLILKPSSEEFSALENICHLRDIEIEGYAVRIHRILNEESPLLEDIDGGRLAIERAYNEQDLNEALQSFSRARQQNVALLSQANEEQLNRTGMLEGVGDVTLGKLMLMMNEHDDGHLDELRTVCRKVRLLVDD